MRRCRRRRRRRRGSQDSTGESDDSDSWSDSSEYDSDLEEEWGEERDWLGQLSPGGTTKTGASSSAIASAKKHMYSIHSKRMPHCFVSMAQVITNA